MFFEKERKKEAKSLVKKSSEKRLRGLLWFTCDFVFKLSPRNSHQICCFDPEQGTHRRWEKKGTEVTSIVHFAISPNHHKDPKPPFRAHMARRVILTQVIARHGDRAPSVALVGGRDEASRWSARLPGPAVLEVSVTSFFSKISHPSPPPPQRRPRPLD